MRTFMTYERHPLSAAFPSLSADEIASLADDIQTNGLREPIILFQGQVIDGWNRYTAIQRTDVEPRFVELGDVDPVAFVLSANLHRRHLSESQKAQAVVLCHQWRPVGNPEFSNRETSPDCKTNAELAELAGVSDYTIKQAKTVIREAPELVERVTSGELKVNTAARIAKGEPSKPKAEASAEDWKFKYELLQAEHADLQEKHNELISIVDELQAENIALHKTMESDDKLAAALSEGKELRAKLRDAKEHAEGWQAKSNEAVKAAKRWKAKADKVRLNG